MTGYQILHGNEYDQVEDDPSVCRSKLFWLKRQWDGRKAMTRNSPYLWFIILSLSGSLLAGMLVLVYNKSSPTTEPLSFDQLFDGSLTPRHVSSQWSKIGASEILVLLDTSGVFMTTDLDTEDTQFLVNVRWFRDRNGRPLSFTEWQLSPSRRFMLIKTDPVERWHRSKFGNYYIHDITKNKTFPLVEPTSPPLTIAAMWAPSEDIIAFVHRDDLHLSRAPFTLSKVQHISYPDSSSKFSGVGDWVYEEEVLFVDRAFWWSPDSRRLAFLSFDDSEIDEYRLPLPPPSDYNDPHHRLLNLSRIKYPLPGGKNPVVNAYVTDLSSMQTRVLTWPKRFPLNSSIIFEITWTNPHVLLLKEMTRNAAEGNLVAFEVGQSFQEQIQGFVTRSLTSISGWLDCEQTMFALPGGTSAYLDILENPEGYRHIAYFTAHDNQIPLFLTTGNWEVTGKILGVNSSSNIVYFQAAYPTSIQRHILAASLFPDAARPMVALTVITELSHYRADFSPGSSHYVLSYDGPDIPVQKLMRTHKNVSVLLLEDNSNLRRGLDVGRTSYSTISVDGYDFNVKEIRPSKMDTSGRTKYPVLFRVSNAPSSQLVHTLYRLEWESYLASTFGYVIVVADCRGTGNQGANFRRPLKNRLGFWEASDQIHLAQLWAKKDYIDISRIGIWGWSYGGYVTLKVLEDDAAVHSLAMAVSPVVNWRLYDSIFTERYLDTPVRNPDGYLASSVRNLTALSAHLLLAHGTADINVHFDNSVHLLRLLADADIEDFSFKVFPDSDHAMHGAYKDLFRYMGEFLRIHWGSE